LQTTIVSGTPTLFGDSVTVGTESYQAYKYYSAFNTNTISYAFITGTGAALYLVGARFPQVKDNAFS